MRLSAVILGLVMMGCVATQAVAQVGPAYSGNYGYVCTHNTNGTVMLRKGAGQHFGVIAKMPNGSDVSVLAQANARDGFVWYKVRYGTKTGWARSDYICS